MPPDLLAFDLATVRALGAVPAARAAVARLTRPGLTGSFVHIDADCLDDSMMPAVDYRTPGGLAPAELVAILALALRSRRLVGMEVTVCESRPRFGRHGWPIADGSPGNGTDRPPLNQVTERSERDRLCRVMRHRSSQLVLTVTRAPVRRITRARSAASGG